MVKELLNNWLEQRRKSSFPPLEAHEADKLLAFASWADSEAAQQSVQRTLTSDPVFIHRVKCSHCGGDIDVPETRR